MAVGVELRIGVWNRIVASAVVVFVALVELVLIDFWMFSGRELFPLVQRWLDPGLAGRGVG